MRFKALALCLSAMGAALMASCSGSPKEDENASVVNIEKQVAPAISTPDVNVGPEIASEAQVGIVGAESSGNAVSQEEDTAQPEASPAENENAVE